MKDDGFEQDEPKGLYGSDKSGLFLNLDTARRPGSDHSVWIEVLL